LLDRVSNVHVPELYRHIHSTCNQLCFPIFPLSHCENNPIFGQMLDNFFLSLQIEAENGLIDTAGVDYVRVFQIRENFSHCLCMGWDLEDKLATCSRPDTDKSIKASSQNVHIITE
jgi:hypothetical protein